jgi:hypothetical protein
VWCAPWRSPHEHDARLPALLSGIVIAPNPLELGLYWDEWEGIQADLEAAGFDAVIEHPYEKHDEGQASVDTVITHPSTKLLDVVVGIVSQRLRDRNRARAAVLILRPGR